MLLNSPMALDIHLQSPQTFISRLASPPPSSKNLSAISSPTSILSSCRALQSLIQCSLPMPTSTPQQPINRLNSPIDLSKPLRPTSASSKQKHKIHKTQPLQRKRRRAPSDTANDQENAMDSKPSTPKRMRSAYPPTLPLGVSRSDFEALRSLSSSSSSVGPSTPIFNRSPDTQFFSPSAPLPFALPPAPALTEMSDTVMEEQGDDWTPEDDAALVQLILQKFRLKSSDWEDCAATLGKGRDSIGERWKVLVGEGEVGLRRGRKGRMGLEGLME